MGATLVKGGRIVTPVGEMIGDIYIEQGRIAAVGRDLTVQADTVVDAAGKWVLPGVVDAHVQLETGFGDAQMTDDFDSGTVAAAHGGVTTVVDFADQPAGTSALAFWQSRRESADRKVNVDYALHTGLTDGSDGTLEEAARLVELGSPTFKCYMAYSRQGRRVDHGELLRIMRKVGRLGGLVEVHAEDDETIEAMRALYEDRGELRVADYADSRPVVAEEIALRVAAALAREAGCLLYVHHLSTARGLDVLQKERRRGAQIIIETCPQFLTLSADVYALPDGHLYVQNPPLRSADNISGLWQGLLSGAIDVLGTDHCSYLRAQKDKHRDAVPRIPAGMPGVETLLPLAYTTFVAERGGEMSRLVQLLSANPARACGLYPRKGALQIGSDGDVVVYDPEGTTVIEPERLHMNCDWNPFRGMSVRGRVTHTILRGTVLVEDGEFVGPRHIGRWVPGDRVLMPIGADIGPISTTGGGLL